MATGDAIVKDLLSKPDSLRERIYADLRKRLQQGAIGLADRLVDIEIAACYGASRMPAREALLQLVNEGYLVGTSRGFVIPRLNLADVVDIFEVRKLLEPRAAANAARDLDASTLAELLQAVNAARIAQRDDDAGQLILAALAFRAAWLGAVKNARLANTIARFIDHVQTVRLRTVNDPAIRRIVADGLEGLYDAFARRDPVVASDRMSTFIGAVEQAYFSARKAELEDGSSDPNLNSTHSGI
jgi:DNA-binding GntR family transcriptional regulator